LIRRADVLQSTAERTRGHFLKTSDVQLLTLGEVKATAPENMSVARPALERTSATCCLYFP
jgi:hypothetical protein